jgi:hypothetical protein
MAEMLEEVRCRADLGAVAVGPRNFPVFHDVLCASEPFPATVLDDRDAVIENLIRSGKFTRKQMAEICGFSRQRIDQILRAQRP